MTGVDYFKEALEWEEKMCMDSSNIKQELLESTVENIRKVDDIDGAGQNIGRSLFGYFKKDEVERFCKNIIEGYNESFNQDEYDKNEMEKVSIQVSKMLDKSKNN